ncbi:F-box/LRR-repeat protein [Cardamine amara subsp. amara]|uniref:F-box/LRR-repeat protein n=1 Tax=Cardamine amara subsp. amara TaxID=228776 RepID=A0ABD1BIX9_CARAN
MGQEEKNPNKSYIVADVVEDILLRLPLKSILKCKTVSKQWKSIVESKWFAERRMSGQKIRKILATGESRFKGDGDGESEMVYLKCDDVTQQPFLTCDGLVCIPVPGWVNVLNPSTGQFLGFPCGPSHNDYTVVVTEVWCNIFPGYWAMGFGRDQVNGRYKVVRMSFDPNLCHILDVNNGEWRKLSPPPYKIEAIRKSACVNGSIYWLNLLLRYKILALDLHTEEFRNVQVLPPTLHMVSAQLVNLEDRLAIADTCVSPEWKLEIWSMDAQEESWSKTYSISLSHRVVSEKWWKRWFTPVAVSKQGSLFFYDNENRLFKYYPETDFLRCLSLDAHVICPYVENLVSLPLQQGCLPTSGYRYGYVDQVPGSRISAIVRGVESQIPNILLTSTLVSLIIFGYKYCT